MMPDSIYIFMLIIMSVHRHRQGSGCADDHDKPTEC